MSGVAVRKRARRATVKKAGPQLRFTLGKFKKMSLAPNDVIVITYPRLLNSQQLELITEGFKKAFPNHQCVVLQGGMDVGVLSPK